MSKVAKLGLAGLVVIAVAIGAFIFLNRDPIPSSFVCSAQSICSDGTNCSDILPTQPLLLTGFDENGATLSLAAIQDTPAEVTKFSRPSIGSAGGMTFKGQSNLGNEIEFFYGHEIRGFKYQRVQNGTLTEIVGYCVTE